MDKELGQAANQPEIPTEAAAAPVGGSSRRRFTRNTVVGSAVLLSLGNRTAWGARNNDGTCLSASLLASFVAAGNTLGSFAPRQLNEDAMKIVNAPEKKRYTSGKDVCVKKND